jgi:hypothetical protein
MATQDDELNEGEIYVVQKGKLKHIQREEDGLRKVPISESAYEELLDLRRRCRHSMGGFRPDSGLVASALIEFVAPLYESAEIVAKYHAKILDDSKKATSNTSSLASEADSDDAPAPQKSSYASTFSEGDKAK